ncbi:MAG: hypothetical protein ACP5UV_04550 [Thermoplasmata archaeon]
MQVYNYHTYSLITITGLEAMDGFSLWDMMAPSSTYPVMISPGSSALIQVNVTTPYNSYSGPLVIDMNTSLSKITVTSIDIQTTIQGLFGPSPNSKTAPDFNATPGTVYTIQLTFYNSNLIDTDTITSIYIEGLSGTWIGGSDGSPWSTVVEPPLEQEIPAGQSLTFTISIALPLNSYNGSLELVVYGYS